MYCTMYTEQNNSMYKITKIKKKMINYVCRVQMIVNQCDEKALKPVLIKKLYFLGVGWLVYVIL